MKHPDAIVRRMLFQILVGFLCVGFGFSSISHAERPNILWFVVDDMSVNFSCYGETAVQTPNVDKLAAQGTRFSRAYVTGPVCSACRSALITGMYQTSIGSHHHRSGRGKLKINLPNDVQPVPVLFQKAGYYTCSGSGLPDKDFRGVPFGTGAKAKKDRMGKTDYNFQWEASMYDSYDWSGRAANQPFFMQVQLNGGKLREGAPAGREAFRKRVISELGSATNSEQVTLPPYYPRDPVLLDDWAAYLDAVRLTDKHVGEVIARLEAEDLLDNTLIIFMTDHGISHARGKQFLYDEGTRVPFVVRGPGIAQAAVRADFAQQIDLAAISLAAAGIDIPSSMQGRDLMAKEYQPREFAYGARDRCDETIERLRSVRSDRFLYIRNFYPERPHLQPNAYKDGKQIVQTLRELNDRGVLSLIPKKMLFSPTRPAEELYEYAADPHQIINLADTPAFKLELERHRAELDRWIAETKDKGPESEEMYDSDMAVYLEKANPEVERNIALMKKWAREGK
jgi:arylsulfatase A-like enzyme